MITRADILNSCNKIQLITNKHAAMHYHYGRGILYTMNVIRKIYSDGREEEVNQKWTLAQMQEFVGGYIEMVPSNIPHRSLVVNEDGLLKELPHNMKASELVHPRTFVLDFIRGNALLVKS